MNHPARIVRPESERRGCLPILNPWRPATISFPIGEQHRHVETDEESVHRLIVGLGPHQYFGKLGHWLRRELQVRAGD
jgi:hypothetical protein